LIIELRSPSASRIVCVGALALLVTSCATTSTLPSDVRDDTTPVRFENPAGSAKRTSIVTRLPKLLARFIRYGFAPETRDRSHVLAHADAVELLESFRDESSVTWIGHMTVLLRIDGRTILTDPWWSDYASPIPGIGPKRYVPPALRIDELPPVDVVVISHSHYDHLDLGAIVRLPNRHRIAAVVPLGLGAFFRERGYGTVVELAWQESVEIDGMKLTALPAIHWSKRTAFKMNDTLWAAFAIEGPSGVRIFFGGDSDYGPVHADVASRWDGFDLALLSIGGFHNDGVHCTPEECVLLGMDLGARVLLPLHWGTIYLGEGPPRELPARFAAAAADNGLDAQSVWTLQIGETRALPRRPRVAPAAPITATAR
jgi:L-ascorbate metabolism protein UlaG (beta-lactamase superfamily)